MHLHDLDPSQRRLRRLTINTVGDFWCTIPAAPRNEKFRATWHRLALRVFFTIPDFERLTVRLGYGTPLVWGTESDASQARVNGDP